MRWEHRVPPNQILTLRFFGDETGFYFSLFAITFSSHSQSDTLLICIRSSFYKISRQQNTLFFFSSAFSKVQRSFLVCRLFGDVSVCVLCQGFCIFPRPSLLMTSHLWTFMNSGHHCEGPALTLH